MNKNLQTNCYTYLIGWSSLNKWYYGRKTSNGCDPSNLWVTYFTSSNHVKQFRLIYGDPDIIQVRKTFGNNKQACCGHENKVLRRIDAAHNSNFLNKTNGDALFDATGKHAAICATTGMRLGLVATDDPRWDEGKIISTAQGRKSSRKLAKSVLGDKVGMVNVDDPRWATGEIIHYNKNVSAVCNKNNAPAIDSKTHELLGRISLDDDRWRTGEIISMFKDYVNVIDGTGTIVRVHKSDPKYISGEYINACVGTHRTESQKQNMSSKHKQMRQLNRVSCLITRKEYSIPNFTRYVLNRQPSEVELLQEPVD